MPLADDGDDLDAALLEHLGHLHGNDIASTRGNDECRVIGSQGKVAQDAHGQSTDIFEEHRLTLSIGSHHQIVKGQRQFHDGIPARKGAITRPHFFDHHPRMAGAKDVDHASCQDGAGEPFGSLMDQGLLGSYPFQDDAGMLKKVCGGGHSWDEWGGEGSD